MSKEVMQQALEALEARCGTQADERGPGGAITALREALAEQPAQQEPVAWRDPTNANPGQGCTYIKARAEKFPHIYKQALYTSPPAQPAQRELVCLTDEEVLGLFGKFSAMTGKGWLYLYRITEAKLKEKNHG